MLQTTHCGHAMTTLISLLSIEIGYGFVAIGNFMKFIANVNFMLGCTFVLLSSSTSQFYTSMPTQLISHSVLFEFLYFGMLHYYKIKLVILVLRAR